MIHPVFLFDIDGTLVTKCRPHPTRKQRAFTESILKVYGIPGINYMNYPIFGLTDRGILRLLLRNAGLSEIRIAQKEHAFFHQLEKTYQALTADGIREYCALPGVPELLKMIRGYPLGIATGNIRFVAEHKLRDADIEAYFSFGGYGDDAEERADIVSRAINKAPPGSHDDVVLFGDTPNDLEAGRKVGCRVVGVATGRFTFDELTAHASENDCIVHSLSEIDRIRRFCFPGDK